MPQTIPDGSSVGVSMWYLLLHFTIRGLISLGQVYAPISLLSFLIVSATFVWLAPP